MTFVDTGSFGGGGSPFGMGGVGAGINPGPPGGAFGGPGFGGGQSKLTGGLAPGTVSPFDQAAVGQAANLSGEAMMNRYAQLGLSSQGATPTSPGGAPGGVGNPAQMPTAEAMDLGTGFPGGLPSLGGGVTGEAEAVLGQIQNANLQQSSSGGSGGGGKGGGGKGGLGGLTSLAALGGK